MHFFSSGILKNRPALGEQALQELINDGLLKFNYFLTDIRGRNVKSYMKIPIPTATDVQGQELLKKKLIKHEINVEEYYSTYDKFLVTPNNKLSTLSIEIFRNNASLVPYYARHRSQLEAVIREYIQNGHIQEAGEDRFTIINENVFPHRYDDIESLMSHGRQRRSYDISEQVASTQPAANPLVELETIKVTTVEAGCNTTEKQCEMRYHNVHELIRRQDFDIISGKNFFLH